MARTLVAIDIEKSGAMPLVHPIVSIGVCVGDEAGTVIEKRRFNFKVNWKSEQLGGDFEDRCWEEFWSKQPQGLIRLLQEDAQEPRECMKQFEQWLNGLEDRFKNTKIKFLSDNPSFDIGAIDVYLDRYCSRLPMRYSSTKKYRGIDNPSDMLEVFPSEKVKEWTKLFVDPNVSHDHDPANDAEHIYRQWLLVKKMTNVFTIRQ